MEKIFNKIKEDIKESKDKGNLVSILIREDEFYLNYWNNEKIESYCYNLEGNLIKKELFDPTKQFTESDFIKSDELNFKFKKLGNLEKKDIIISKKEGKIEIVIIDLKNQTITKSFVIDGEIREVENLKFSDLFKFL